MRSNIYIYSAFIMWGVISLIIIFKAYKGKKVNLYIYRSIPNVFTTIGVLGTFIGIYIGLQEFDTNEISKSIPKLLEGLKTAFLTSIIGIISSIIFGRLSELAFGYSENKKENKPTNEVNAINKLIDEIIKLNENNSEKFESLNNSLEGNNSKLHNQIEILEKISSSLGDDMSSSIGNLIKDFKIESENYFKSKSKFDDKLLKNQVDLFQQHQKHSKSLDNELNTIVSQMDTNSGLIQEKFEEFSELLARNNTEALVEVMTKVTEEFNAQMSELINKLVQENFQELNNSVARLNEWQIQNKEMIADLTNKHTQTVNEFKISSKHIKEFSNSSLEIVNNTDKLTNKNSELISLISTLKEVLIDDERFKSSTNNLLNAIEKVEKNIDAFDKTTHKLNDWVSKERGVKQSVESLMSQLEGISKIRDYNEDFWKQTKKQLNEGVGVLSNTTEMLNSNLGNINREFQDQLSSTLTSLDELIQRLMRNQRN